MKWKLVLVLLAALAAGGVLLASQQEQRQSGSETEDQPSEFVPTEKVPAGGAISFPVDI